MSLALMLAVQAAAAQPPAPAPAPPVPSAPAAIDFDLARYRPAWPGVSVRSCRGEDSAPIVVCAPRRGGGYPLDEMARLFAEPPLVAEMGLGGAAAARLYGQSAELDRGAVAQRIMVGIRLPF